MIVAQHPALTTTSASGSAVAASQSVGSPLPAVLPPRSPQKRVVINNPTKEGWLEKQSQNAAQQHEHCDNNTRLATDRCHPPAFHPSPLHPVTHLTVWCIVSGRMLKRWRRRWFVLQDSTLYSFKKERVYDEPTEIIDLRVFSSVKSSEDYTHRAHSFDVYSTDMVFSMVAPSESDKEGHNSYHAQQQHARNKQRWRL